jgi:CRP-like cAMP-binding protein
MNDGVEPVAGSLFDYLDTAAREFVLSSGAPRSFGTGEVLLRHGDPTDHVMVLVTGWVRVSVCTKDGQQVLFGLRGPGDVVGELAALNGWKRTATVHAVEDVRVVRLTRRQFLDCLRDRPDVVLAMAKQMADRLREAETVRVDLATLDVSRRVAGYLQRLADQHGVRGRDGVVIGMPLTQQDIANRVGASRRAVCRSMALLRERRVVATTRRRIVLTRPEGLRSFAHSEPDVAQPR